MARLDERFWSKVNKDAPDGHWLWTGAKNREGGYPLFRVGGKLKRAHHLTYESAHGPIPANKDVDHLCRERMCVNPEHLQAVSLTENNRRGRGGDHSEQDALLKRRMMTKVGVR